MLISDKNSPTFGMDVIFAKTDKNYMKILLLFSDPTVRRRYNIMKEHHRFLTETEISLISDKGLTMEVYWDFSFGMVQPKLLTLLIQFFQ